MSRLDKFSLFTGIIGLISDTIAIGTFAVSVGLFIPNFKIISGPPEGGLLLTAILGLYSLAMIVWYLLRLARAKGKMTAFGFDELIEDREWPLYFVPLLGAFTAITVPALAVLRLIFFLALFFAFLPATLWIYVLSANIWIALIVGLLGSAFVSQYAIFFALVLDKFFN